jgi:hypothetical protein
LHTVGMSRKLSHDFRFVARTAPDLYDEMGHFVLRAAGAGLKFRGRKVGVEAALNAIVLDFLTKPEEERLALLRENLPRFEVAMGGVTTAQEVPAEAPDPPPRGPIIAAVKQANPAAEPADPRPAPRRRRKNG